MSAISDARSDIYPRAVGFLRTLIMRSNGTGCGEPNFQLLRCVVAMFCAETFWSVGMVGTGQENFDRSGRIHGIHGPGSRTARSSEPSKRCGSILACKSPMFPNSPRAGPFSAKSTRRDWRHWSRSADSHSLDDVYCRHILEGRLPELIPDTSLEPLAKAMPITAAANIGCHISVPIRLPDGRPYGMFCCLGFEANPSLNARDLQTMRAFADLAAFEINRDLDDCGSRRTKARTDRTPSSIWTSSRSSISRSGTCAAGRPSASNA